MPVLTQVPATSSRLGPLFPYSSGQGNRLIALVNLFGNIIPFMPIGLLAPLVVRSLSWRKTLVLGVGTGLTFEVMEVVFRVGIFDVDDVILNTFGVLAGYGVFAMFKRRAQPQPRVSSSVQRNAFVVIDKPTSGSSATRKRLLGWRKIYDFVNRRPCDNGPLFCKGP